MVAQTKCFLEFRNKLIPVATLKCTYFGGIHISISKLCLLSVVWADFHQAPRSNDQTGYQCGRPEIHCKQDVEETCDWTGKQCKDISPQPG